MRQLSVLLGAGMPLLSALDSLVSNESSRELATQGGAVRRDLRSGGRLSRSIEAHMPALPSYATRLIELGEITGQLPSALRDVATQMEQDLKAASEVRNALAYPAFLACAGLAAIVFIVMFVVPRFAALIGDDRGQLPAFSRWLIETSLLLRDNWPVALGAIALPVGLLIFSLRNDASRRSLEQGLHRLPVVKTFLKAPETARWARVAGTALKGEGETHRRAEAG